MHNYMLSLADRNCKIEKNNIEELNIEEQLISIDNKDRFELPITRTHFDSPFEFELSKFYCIPSKSLFFWMATFYCAVLP